MRKLFILLLVAVLLAPAAVSASTVVTSFYPVWLLTLNLTAGIDGITVRNLAAPDTGCLHDYTLMPSDMLALSGAEALLINGAGMESFLPMVLEACPGLPVIDASEGIELLEEDEDEDHDHEENDHEEHDHEGHSHEGHSHGEEGNSHIWLDPLRASEMAENLAEGLIRMMPEHAGAIRANLADLQARLTALAALMKSSVQDLSGRDVIIMHKAFPYFAEACGLNVIETVDKEPEDNLPASRLAELIRTVSASPVLPVVIRSTEEDPAVSVLAEETGVPVCALDTLASGPDNPPLDYYEITMLNNLRLISDALSE